MPVATARVAHIARLARARTRSRTQSSAVAPVVLEKTPETRVRVVASFHEGKRDEEPLPTEDVGEHPTVGGSEAGPSHLEAWLDTEQNRCVPDVVGAELTDTVNCLVQDRAKCLITEAIERLLDSSRS